MDELRWILLGAGVALIAGVYLWGLRARRSGAASRSERAARPAPAVAPRIEPAVGTGDDAVGTPESAAPFAFDTAEEHPPRAGVALRREPRLEPRLDPSLQADPPTLPPTPAGAAAGAEPAAPPSQLIVALRVVAPPAESFDGAALRAAIEAEGLVFGRYQVFHRLDAAGRSLFSLASLREPGSFDLATMDRAAYRGVALFAVLPGPLPGAEVFDELVATTRAIAGRLGGLLQDERGAVLGPLRSAQLRASAAAIPPAGSPRLPDG
jgi:cell division protein ZipA